MALGRSAAAAAAGFGAGFDAVVTAEEVGFYKPDARAYEEVLRRLGIRAEEALFVAGSAADVVCTYVCSVLFCYLLFRSFLPSFV